MKKLMIVLLTIALTAFLGFAAAMAENEETDQAVIRGGIENGSYVIRIPVEENDQGWFAESTDFNPVVKLAKAEIADGDFVVQYDPVADGVTTVCVRHYYCAVACDEAHTWDLKVENGAVVECVGGSYTANPGDDGLDEALCGEWLEKDTQFSRMTIEKNEGRGWDVEIVSPLTHGAFVFKATVYYDCWESAFLYDKGKFFDVPITDEADAELGEAVIAGSAGCFEMDQADDEPLILRWINGESPDEPIDFVREDAEEAAAIARFEGEWQCDRAAIEVYWEEEGFKVLIRWGSSAWEHTEWEYSCYYHEDDGTLVSMPFGTRTEYVYSDDGEIVSATEAYSDGEAAFCLDEEGCLIWLDGKENAGEGMRFVRVPDETPQFGTVGEAIDADGSIGMYGTYGEYYAVIVEADGKIYRAVAEMDEKAGELLDAIFEAEDSAAADAAYREYVNTLPIQYVEEITAMPMSQEELDALAGKTIGELEADGFEEKSSCGSPYDDVVFTMAKGMYAYDFTVAESYEAYVKEQESQADFSAFTVKSGTLAGVSNNILDLDYQADGAYTGN